MTINTDDYYIESKKAIQATLEREDMLLKKMQPEHELTILQSEKKEVRTPEEFEAINERIEELKRKIRFNQLSEPAIPAEFREAIKRNVHVEGLATSEKLNELKGQLKEKIELLENEILPLVESIRDLEKMSLIPEQIGMLLTAEIGYMEPMTVSARSKLYHPNGDRIKAGNAVKLLNGTLLELKGISVPVETNKFIAFLKRGKK
ncbi:hypothetical protein [Sporosarcina sp. FSL W7-1283]|uniref:hypothetical protein n=1 Tax=Sporosarcina sp. FSL W7-1283 TaxID=2921560 RepID=UPI0030FB8DAD